ncbi:cytidine and deoxycytidylate deaminase zinc-binding region family protein [Mycobacterium ulcerans str. Harvey]|uniref:Cytidine and deoxycytidylate deaminase zinc-binding region family protein n=1 Tax=Mycobacterium ulcerans str. Harvey TaxID=1299332 RepID=A0ABN0R187_MYCUL|nr:cytidine and deoxycytidylate deaminase zinc-binding region family protein [Mycobacterium ulcerans str. Harvey]
MTVEQVKSLEEAMRLAIEQSMLVKGTTYPNPPVGAVIVDQEGWVVGIGGTQPSGGDHAEVVALRKAGGLAAGAIAVVTMEPCNHFGKTPPCVNALIEARVGTVIYGVADPNGIAGGARAAVGRRPAGAIRRAGRSCGGRTVAGVAAQAAHRVAACDLEVRHEYRWP